ncbi:MAG: serine hydrolase [Ramlibacter sp.]
MKRFAVVVTALILALSQHAFAQSGCRPGFINPQRFFPSNEAKPSSSPHRFEPGEPLGSVGYRPVAFADDTVEELLRMSSGVALKTSYVRGEPSDNQATDPMTSPRQNMRGYLRGKTEVAAKGKQFDYKGAVSALLGLALGERTGQSNTDYLADKLWSAMGAESRGYWIKNSSGEEGVQGQFVATLRDYGRLGYLVMNGGAVDGRQVVPAPWIAQMATLRRDKPQPPDAPFYGLHVWIPAAARPRTSTATGISSRCATRSSRSCRPARAELLSSSTDTRS